MNRFLSYFMVGVMCLFGGYFWRLYQETEHRSIAFDSGKKYVIKVIRKEAKLRKTFFIEDLKFISRKDGAINVKGGSK